MKKRILSVFLALMMLIPFSAMSVSAVLEENTFFKATLFGEEYGVIGEKYTAYIKFEEFTADEFLGATCMVDYDADVFEIDSVYLSIIKGETNSSEENAETYALVEPEDGWVFWGNNNIDGSVGTFSLHVLNDLIKSLKGDSLTCFIDFKVKENANEGESIIKIDTDSQLFGVFSETLIESKNGTGSELSVNIVKELPNTPEYLIIRQDSTYEKVYSDISKITILKGFRESTTVAEFKSNFENEYEKLAVISNGTILNDNQYVPTNSTIALIKNDVIHDSCVVVCIGDVDCSGNVDSTDYMQIKKYFLGEHTLEGAILAASDVDMSGEIDSTDYMRLKMYFLNILDIYA